MEEMESVRLKELAVVHQESHLQGCGGKGVNTNDTVHSFRRSQVMADRANPTESLHQDREFPKGPSLNESLEPSELNDMEAGLFDFCLIVQKDSDLPMPFNTGHGFYDYPPGLRCITHVVPL